MANDKLSKENLPLLHQQTPRHNLKATADCVALPPCCKNAPVGYCKSETLRVIREGSGGGGDSACERGGDARRLAQGCKFRILV